MPLSSLEMFLNTFVTDIIHCYIFCKITEMSFNCIALARFQGSIPLGGDALTSKSAFPKLPMLGTFPLVSASPSFTCLHLPDPGKAVDPPARVFSLSRWGLDTIRKKDTVVQVPVPQSEALC